MYEYELDKGGKSEVSFHIEDEYLRPIDLKHVQPLSYLVARSKTDCKEVLFFKTVVCDYVSLDSGCTYTKDRIEKHYYDICIANIKIHATLKRRK